MQFVTLCVTRRFCDVTRMIIVPTLRVGMPFVTLRVTSLQCSTTSCCACRRPPYVLFDHDGTNNAECDLSDG